MRRHRSIRLNSQRLAVFGIVGAVMLSSSLAADIPVPGTVTDAIGWYRDQAAAGNRDAQFLLARLYEQGSLGTPDLPTAFDLYRKAADNGHPEAQLKMADARYFGGPLKQEYAEAAKWYAKAADAGVVRAQYNLALMLERGRGVPVDVARAAALYIKSATAGLGAAQIGLSILYSQGRGVEKNPVRALMWLTIATAQKAPISAGIRESISAGMTDAERTEAQRLAEEWLALRPPKR